MKLTLDQYGASASWLTLNNISLEVDAGEIHAIFGENGSGKSTLAKALSGNEEIIESGLATLDNMDMLGMKTHERAKAGFQVVFQKVPSIPGLTYLQALRAATSDRISEEVDPISFYKEITALCESYGIKKELLQKSVGTDLSGGEQKKMELLQILLHKPGIILLDEIEAGLDVETLRSLSAIISDIANAGTGVIIISHNLGFLRTLPISKVHIMNQGTLTTHPSEIFETL